MATFPRRAGHGAFGHVAREDPHGVHPVILATQGEGELGCGLAERIEGGRWLARSVAEGRFASLVSVAARSPNAACTVAAGSTVELAARLEIGGLVGRERIAERAHRCKEIEG